MTIQSGSEACVWTVLAIVIGEFGSGAIGAWGAGIDDVGLRGVGEGVAGVSEEGEGFGGIGEAGRVGR